MKKTFKKAFILMAVLTVMMICALALPASAEGTICTEGGTLHTNLEEKYTPPTCTQDGFTEVYCSACKTVVSTKYDERSLTGHSFVVDRYEAIDGAYRRVVRCTNDVCVRENEDFVTELKSTDVYYAVDFVNTFESPELGEVADHKSYFLEYYYVEKDRDTWVVDLTKGERSYYPEAYAPAKAENTSVEVGADIESVVNPDYEYFNNNGEVELYVLNGKKAVYNGNKPTRNKDTEIGRYTFDTWVVGDTAISDYTITENTTFNARFTANENVALKYTFMNGNAVITTSETDLPHGHSISFDLAVPTKDRTVEYTYNFSGWKVDNIRKVETAEGYTPATTPITLYHEAIIYADYDQIANKYTIAFENYAGEPFGTEESPLVLADQICGTNVLGLANLTDKDIERPSSPAYNYSPTGAWKISKINGIPTASDAIIVDLNRMMLPSIVYVNNGDGTSTPITSDKYEVVTVSPVYNSSAIQYTIRVRIYGNYFEESDLLGTLQPRPDILDDFNIIAYDGNGNYITNTMTDENGEAVIRVPYRDIINIKATSLNNKYKGEHSINMRTVYSQFLPSGVIGIAPSISQEWLEGNTHDCSCLCHTFLSSILIKIYNVLYSLFKIEYVCCDDLFATHGDVLAYTNPS